MFQPDGVTSKPSSPSGAGGVAIRPAAVVRPAVIVRVVGAVIVVAWAVVNDLAVHAVRGRGDNPPCESPGRWPSMSQSTRSTPPTTDSRCPTTSATTPPGRVSTRRSSTVWRRSSGSCLPPADTRTDSTHRAVRRTRRHNDPHSLHRAARKGPGAEQ